ncbi:MAG: hypothetical protein QHJ73_16195, partial [Armatimonadota bacterium]|nr:hypothetical protein [Armatimonadota bacterium]
MRRTLWLAGILPLLLVAVAATAQTVGWGPWWNRVTPTTPQQKALVDEVKGLHAQIWQKQAELRALQLQPQPNEAAVRAKQAEVDALRKRVQELMVKNQAVVQQMVPQATAGGGRGPCGLGLGPCGGVPGSACPYGWGPGAGMGM